MSRPLCGSRWTGSGGNRLANCAWLAQAICRSHLDQFQTRGSVRVRLFVVAIAMFTLVTGPPLASGAFVSHWQGEGNLLDSVGPNHGTSSGQISYEPGIVGQAIRFPDDGYIDIRCLASR
jgi:hypothetical protein